MGKITKFKDIQQFTSAGTYQVNYPLTSLVRYIEEEIEEMGLQLNPEFQRVTYGLRNSKLHGLNIIFAEANPVTQFI